MFRTATGFSRWPSTLSKMVRDERRRSNLSDFILDFASECSLFSSLTIWGAEHQDPPFHQECHLLLLHEHPPQDLHGRRGYLVRPLSVWHHLVQKVCEGSIEEGTPKKEHPLFRALSLNYPYQRFKSRQPNYNNDSLESRQRCPQIRQFAPYPLWFAPIFRELMPKSKQDWSCSWGVT